MRPGDSTRQCRVRHTEDTLNGLVTILTRAASVSKQLAEQNPKSIAMKELQRLVASAHASVLTLSVRGKEVKATFKDQEVLRVVAVEGSNNDWAAYTGHGVDDEVASSGHKLPRDVAEALFPHWAEYLVYRQ